MINLKAITRAVVMVAWSIRLHAEAISRASSGMVSPNQAKDFEEFDKDLENWED